MYVKCADNNKRMVKDIDLTVFWMQTHCLRLC